MYNITKYNFAGEIIGQSVHPDAPAPDNLREYASIEAQLESELWDLRDGTDPLADYNPAKIDRRAIAIIGRF